MASKKKPKKMSRKKEMTIPGAGKGGYYVYLNKCLLPVTPGKIEMKINNSNKTIKLINDGEINILKTPGLTDIDFECEIPQQQYPYAVYKNKFQKASYFLNYFEKLKKNKKYYVRVRSYKVTKVNNKSKNVYSAWSAKKALKTKKK